MPSPTSPDLELREVPAPANSGPLASLRQLHRKGQLRAYQDWWQEAGDVFRIRLGPKRVYLFSRPEHIRHIHVTHAERYAKGFGYTMLRRLLGNGVVVSEGLVWKESRRRMQPLFLQAAVEQYVPAVISCLETIEARWQSAISRSEPLVIHEEMMRLTMLVISRCLLGTHSAEDVERTGAAMHDALQFVAQRTITLLPLPLLVPTPRNLMFRRRIGTAHAGIRRMVERFRSANHDHSPLLNALMQHSSEIDLSDEQVLAEVVNIFFAGYETTSLALTWALYLLACHPDIQERLAAEATKELGGSEPSGSVVGRLLYTRAVIQETIRLYPPAWIIAREAIVDDVIDGYAVPAGALVLNSQYLTHRHPEFWHEPEAFRPDRFLNGGQLVSPSAAYFPFGAGQRTCLGDNFALMEMTTVLSLLARRYRWESVDDQPIEAVGVGTLHPSRPVRLVLRRR